MKVCEILKDYLNYYCAESESKFLENFIDSFVNCNYENCAYLLRDYLNECYSYTHIDVHYDFERELFYR